MTQRNYPHHEAEDQRSESSQAHTSKFACEDDESLSICVVEAVADVIGTDPKELQPLYEVIDPDALNGLFETPSQYQQGCIMFRFEGCNVTIGADEWIAVSPRTTDGE